MQKYLIVVPAYGVKLNNLAQVRDYHEKERDFLILGAENCNPGGRYIAKHEAEKAGIKLQVYYGNGMQKLTIL